MTAWSAPSNPPATLKYYIKGISDDAMKKNVEQFLDSAKGTHELTLDDIQTFYQVAPTKIQEALQPFGYFRSNIQSSLTHKGNKWEAYFTIILGPPMPIISVDVSITGTGQNDPIFNNLLENFPIKVDDTFTTDRYDTAKQALFVVANNNGYPTAAMSKQEVKIDLRNYVAEITLELNSGPRYYFDNIHIKPNYFYDSFLKRFAKFKPGEVYSAQKTLDFQQNLSGSNYFDNVLVKPEISDNPADHIIPIEVEVTPTKRFLYSIGAGYGTDTGFRGSLGFQWRRITRSGHYLTSNLLASEIGNNFTTNYFIPGSDPVNDQYNITVSVSNLDTAIGRSFVQNYRGGYTTKSSKWRQMYNLILAFEQYNLTDQPTHHSRLLMPNANFFYVDTDNLIKPTYGVSWSINLTGGAKYLLSDTDFIQASVESVWIQPFSYYNRMILTTSIGATLASNFDQLPLSIRFSAGGADSVRGYGFQTLGPGQYLFTASLQLQQRIYGDFFIGAFYDTGNAFNSWKDLDLHSGVGPALIWASPVGNIELSYAKALTLPGQPWAIQFSIGALL